MVPPMRPTPRDRRPTVSGAESPVKEAAISARAGPNIPGKQEKNHY